MRPPRPPVQNIVTPPPPIETNEEPQSPPNILQTVIRSARRLPQSDLAFRKFNDFSAIFALLVAVIYGLLVVLPLYLQNSVITQAIFLNTYLKPFVRILLILIIVVYDAAYARRKVLAMEFESYGIDMVIAGGVGAILAYGSGIFLVIKGFIVMGRALMDKEKNPKYYGSYWDAIYRGFNMVGGFYGLAILFLNIDGFFFPISQLQLTYAYMALFAIIADMAVLVPLVFISKKKSNYPIAFALIICGILARLLSICRLINYYSRWNFAVNFSIFLRLVLFPFFSDFLVQLKFLFKLQIIKMITSDRMLLS